MTHDVPEIDELAALLALDALPAAEQADAELQHGTFAAGLSGVVATLAEPTVDEPPAELRRAVLDSALARRPAGTPAAAPPPCTPTEAFDRTVEDFRELLASLTDAEWDAPAHDEHGPVRELVAHLVGVERLCLAWLDPDAAPPVDPAVDHVTATRPVVDALAETAPADLLGQWYDAARAVAAQAATGDRSRLVSFHDLSSDVDGLLVTRTFELWAHAMDIAFACGRAMPSLDTERMALLSGRLMAAVPYALAYRRQPLAGRTARFVLTGPSGGCYTVPLHPRDKVGADAVPDVTIVTDALDLCRVAARRLPATELVATVEGDRALASTVLAAADAFARD
jgi:uncharacterized protein (TIGR03083 family)